MRKPNIAILGATGVVGREIIKITDKICDFDFAVFNFCKIFVLFKYFY